MPSRAVNLFILVLTLAFLLGATSGVWALDYTTEVIPGPNTEWGMYTALSVGQDGTVHIATLDLNDDDVYYVKGNAGSWSWEMAYDCSSTDYDLALALDSSDNAYIAFQEALYNLKVAYKSGGSWTSSAVHGSGVYYSEYPDLVVDDSGTLHFSYVDIYYNKLMYASGMPSTSFTNEVADDGLPGWVRSYNTSIVLDSGNHAHIAYTSMQSSYDCLYYADNTSGWGADESVASAATNDVGRYADMATDSTGKYHLSYFNFDTNSLDYATGTPGSWTKTTVDANTAGNSNNTAIAVDSDGHAHIAYLGYDSGTGRDILCYATNRTGIWEIFTLDEDLTNHRGEFPDIAVDNYDNVHISYHAANGTDNQLKYAKITYNIPPTQYTLTVTVDPEAGGTVTSADGDISCPGDCEETYDDGTEVELSSHVNSGYYFDQWSGAASGTEATVNLTVTEDMSATALFGAESSTSSSSSSSSGGDSETRTQTLTFAAGSTVGAYRMAALSCIPGSTSSTDLFGSQIGQYTSANMRIGHWNAATQSYEEYPLEDALYAGWTGWFLFRRGANINVTGTAVTPEYDSHLADIRPYLPGHGLTIKEGWNQIGNPFDFAVSTADIKVYDDTHAAVGLMNAANVVTQQAFWVYSSSGYGLANSLAAGQGGWIKKLTPGDGVVFFPDATGSSVTADVVREAPADLEQPPDPPARLAEESGSGGGGGGGCFIGHLD